MKSVRRPRVGERIDVPAWRVRGTVSDVWSSLADPFSTATSTTLLLVQDHDGKERRYRVEPGEWRLVKEN